MKTLRFAARVRLAFLAGLAAVIALCVAAAYFFPSPWTVLLAGAGFGLPVGWWILDCALLPAAQVLGALRDGVQGYRDHDFSLNLAVDRGDELGELVGLYNAVGDVLRDERSALVQREMMLETVFEATPTAIVLTDSRDRILFSNRAARELFATRGRFEGLRFSQVLAGCPEGLREALASGRDSLFSLEPAPDQGGEEEVFHVARRAFELNGRRHDLTLVKRLTPELRRQEVDVWKRAIRTLSHELNNSPAPIASPSRSWGRGVSASGCSTAAPASRTTACAGRCCLSIPRSRGARAAALPRDRRGPRRPAPHRAPGGGRDGGGLLDSGVAQSSGRDI